MIIEFSCSNYKSIKDKIIFSMVATKDNTLDEELYKLNNNIRLVKQSVIYGPNGSGKTNILNAIGYINFLVGECIRFQHGDKIPFYPHKLSDKSETSVFDIQFITGEVRYAYGIEVNNESVVKEYLYHFPYNKQAKIFERECEEYSFGDKFKKELNEIKDSKSKINRLFISTAASWCNMKEIINPFAFLKDSIIVNVSVNNPSWLNYTVGKIEKDISEKNMLLSLLKDMDIGVKGIDAKIETKDFTKEELPNDMPEELKMLLVNRKGVKEEVTLNYGQMNINLNDESRGIKKVFELSGPVFDILRKGQVLIYDELETSLHPYMVLKLIKLFKNSKININNAQLIFSTHDTNLLDLDLFRRDQIWFSEKNNMLSTDIYSLSDLKNIRKDENIEKGYILGKYGSVPFLGGNLIKEWLGE